MLTEIQRCRQDNKEQTWSKDPFAFVFPTNFSQHASKHHILHQREHWRHLVSKPVKEGHSNKPAAYNPYPAYSCFICLIQPIISNKWHPTSTKHFPAACCLIYLIISIT